MVEYGYCLWDLGFPKDQASEDTYAGKGRIVSVILADKQFQFSFEAEEFCSACSVMLCIYSMLVGLPEQRKMSTSVRNLVIACFNWKVL